MRELSQVRRRAAIVSFAVSFFALSFGVLAAERGLSIAKAAAMSLLVFSGGSQFAAVSLADGSEVTAVVAALLLASRLSAFGVLAAPMIAGPRWRQLVGAQLVVDETVLLALEHDEPAVRRAAFWTTGVVLFVSWNVVTVVGAGVGDALGDPAALGIDGAFPAVFVALLAPRLRGPGPRRVALAAVLIAIVLTPLAPAGVPVIAAAAAVIVAGRAEP